ncbi:phage tail tube protein [Roseomonas xinghualingensis]|uniref:phage tail tube protein n=1 Tax=Roseomonas xinghualingensis TaxID=2986475 RepID=UPI0021F14986|nr:phage tail tube protein [Roseomonas sp. SXEYE001]MCV4209377.1 phage tail tube protein [Roseomonas sp. SXEYE001]
MANKRVAGTCYVYQDGAQLQLGGTFNIGPSTKNREDVVGLSGPVGVKETAVRPYMEVEIVKTPELRLTDLEKITDATITAELADGTTAVLYNACQIGELEYTGAEGTITVRWSGSLMEI